MFVCVCSVCVCVFGVCMCVYIYVVLTVYAYTHTDLWYADECETKPGMQYCEAVEGSLAWQVFL